MFSIRKAAFIVLLFTAACADVPAAPAPKVLADAEFQQMFDAARVSNDAFREDRNLTSILSRTDLSLQQRIKTLNFRAIGRSTTGENKNGAIADYEELLRLAAPGDPLIPRVQENLDYVKQQKKYIEDRLEGRARSSNDDRFQDLLALGRHDEAAAFMKQSGLKPNSIYIEKLAKLGYLCEGPGYSGPSYRWGYENTGFHTVYWCDGRNAPVVR
jgi:hypothetical protein